MRCHANIWLVPDSREIDRKIGDAGKGNRHSHDCLWHDQPQCWPTQTAFASAFWIFLHVGPGTCIAAAVEISAFFGCYFILFLDQWGGGYSGGEPTNVRETHKETSTNLTRNGINGLVFDQSWITKPGLTAGRPAISIGRCGCTMFFLTMVKSKWSRA